MTRPSMVTPTCCDQRGLTLMEMLVTLVIVSFIAGVLSQALSQIARIERMLEQGSLPQMNDSLRLEWLRTTLEATVPLNKDVPDAFEGSTTRLHGLSAAAIAWPESTLRPYAVELGYDMARRRGTLSLVLGPARLLDRPQRLELLEWDGPPGSIAYVDEQGAAHDRWPGAKFTPGQRVLPVAVMVRTGDRDHRVLVAGLRSSGKPARSRREIEAL